MKKLFIILLFISQIAVAQDQTTPSSTRGNMAMKYLRFCYWNGSTWTPMADSNHTHTFASLTSKPTTISGYGISDAQPLDADLTVIAGLTATTDNFLLAVANAWASRTPAQAKVSLSLNNVENTAISTWAGSSNIATIGAATGASIAVTGLISSSSSSAGIGYATGAGGTVTQATSRTTGVTINKISGAITTNTTSLAAGAEAEFIVTNSAVAIGDVVVISCRSGQTSSTSVAFVSAVAAGSFKITLSNLHASTADTGAMIINFCVLKAVSN